MLFSIFIYNLYFSYHSNFVIFSLLFHSKLAFVSLPTWPITSYKDPFAMFLFERRIFLLIFKDEQILSLVNIEAELLEKSHLQQRLKVELSFRQRFKVNR